MDSIYYVKQLLSSCYYKDQQDEIVIWRSRFENFKRTRQNQILIKVCDVWCICYNTSTNTFFIANDILNGFIEKLVPPTLFNILDGKEYIMSTGNGDIDFQNAMLYNIVEPSDEWDALFKYINSI